MCRVWPETCLLATGCSSTSGAVFGLAQRTSPEAPKLEDWPQPQRCLQFAPGPPRQARWVSLAPPTSLPRWAWPRRPRPPSGSLGVGSTGIEAAGGVRIAAAGIVELGSSFTRDFCCRLGSAVTSQRAGPAAAMVAKDYPFYLTVKRANCSLEAPLGSGAAKDEVGRALHTPAPPGSAAASRRVPARSLHLPRVLPLQVFPPPSFSVGPLSPGLSLRPRASGTQNPSLCLEPAETPTADLLGRPGCQEIAPHKAVPTPPRPGLGEPKFLGTGSDISPTWFCNCRRARAGQGTFTCHV